MNRYKLKIVRYLNKIYIALAMRFYKFKNRNKNKILIYTDSRGFDVSTYWGRKNPFYKSYVKELIKLYNVDFFICPHFSTTTIDFVYTYSQLKQKYDCIVLHTGLVDYSIRPITMIDRMRDDKKDAIDLIRVITNNKIDIMNKTYEVLECYNHQDCSRFLSIEDYKVLYDSYLSTIPNLIWIGINPVDMNWKGSYWNERPQKINENLDLNMYLNETITNYIDISQWTLDEVRKNTVDNIHLSQEGFEVIAKLLNKKIVKVLNDN